MDVVIDELHSTVDVVDDRALLAPETLERIVRAVLATLEREQLRQRALDADLDLRSVVEQQRDASGGQE